MALTTLDILVIAVPFVFTTWMTIRAFHYTRSVADYLAANRCAGRYMITSASAENSVGIITLAASLEMFSQVGFSLTLWATLVAVVMFFIGVLGVITYRLRETRVLTFHQFFEVRYSRNVRVFASFLNVLSGLFTFGVMPAVGARFFVYLCKFPEQMSLLGWVVPTYVVLMVVFMFVAAAITLSGGQISIMINDALEAMISSFFYVIIAVFIVYTVSTDQMRQVLLSGAATRSYIDPFDITGHKDFNGWFILLTMLMNVYQFRGGLQGFATSATTAHEARMANILGNWRLYNYTAMVVLISLGAFVVLKHPAFAAAAAQAEEGLRNLDGGQLKTQMRMPMALGLLLIPGIKGAFCAVVLYGLLSNQGHQVHTYGATVLQDVVLPLRKKAFSPRSHVLALRLTSIAAAIFAIVFSIIYKPTEYLSMLVRLIGSIYLGGLGCILWGGLYWRRGTSTGAMASLIVGSSLALVLNVIPQIWTRIAPGVAAWLGSGATGDYVRANLERFPINGLWLSMFIAVASTAVYILVSLATCREPFNMEAMLHRGKYRIEGESDPERPSTRRTLMSKLIHVTGEFSRGDKVLAYATVGWTMFWKLLVVALVLWTLLFGRLSSEWWFHYTMISNVWVTLAVGVLVTVWFAWGVVRDMVRMFRLLKTVRRDDADDGRVVDHHNAGESSLQPVMAERK